MTPTTQAILRCLALLFGLLFAQADLGNVAFAQQTPFCPSCENQIQPDSICLDCGSQSPIRRGLNNLKERFLNRTDSPPPMRPSEVVTYSSVDEATRKWEIGSIFRRKELQHRVEQVGEQTLDPYFYDSFWLFTGDVYEDTFSFYSPRQLGKYALAIGGAAILANTKADENFRNWYLDKARNDSPNVHWAKSLGEVGIVPPAIALIWGITECVEYNPATRGGLVNQEVNYWSRQTMRAYAQAALPTIALQWMTGASRPDEKPGKGSSWKFFDDNNGVSGHTVVGAVPFLVAAKMSENMFVKAGFLFASTLPGYARIYDDASFLSQVLLGYAIAYLSVEAVEISEDTAVGFRLVPLTISGTYGLGVERRW